MVPSFVIQLVYRTQTRNIFRAQKSLTRSFYFDKYEVRKFY